MPGKSEQNRNYRFRVEVNGRALLWFSEVSGFDLTTAPGETHVDYSAPPVRRLPGRYKLGNVTFRRGMTESEEMFQWMRGVREGKIDRKSLTITALDEQGVETGVWQVNNAWPTRYSTSAARGEGGEIFIEMLDLAHEGLIRSR